MKILKYKLATETNHGTPEKPMMETVLSDVSMPYATEADYQLALSEAWQGEVTVFPVPLLGRRCRSLQISPDLCGFLGRQPPGGYQLIQTAIVPKAGIVGPRHIIHCHNATPCIAAKKSTSARSCS